MGLSFEDVIEEHRSTIGAKSVNVFLGDEATPERLAAELARQRRYHAVFDSFTKAEQLQAHLARLDEILRKVARLARAGDTEAIVSELDMIPDVDFYEDLGQMIAAREKRGELLPENAIEVYAELQSLEKPAAR